VTRFLAIADLHLGKGGGYGREPGERLQEQETVWERALAIGAERACDAVLFAGDIFEGPLPTPEHYAAFARPLRETHLPIVAISGNGRHDAAMRDTNAVELLDLIADHDRLRVHTRPAVTYVNDVAIACLPWAPVVRLVASQNGGDRDDVNMLAAEMLIAVARELRASLDGPCVLLTHFSISGATLPGGMTSDQLREPVLPLADLEQLGFDAVVAGHLHPPQPLGSLAPDDELMPIFYCGSPLPLDFGEGATDHGVWILEIGADHYPRTEFVPIGSRRFVTIDGRTDDDTFHPWEEVEDAYVKIRLIGTAEAMRRYDLAGLRAAMLGEGGAHNVWIEVTVERETRARVEGLDEATSDVDAFDAWLTAASVNGDQAPALRDLHRSYLEALS
jgi:exonuclease SbcD